MLTVDYLHVCDYASLMQNNKPCIIGIFDRITAPRFPAVHPLLCIAVQFRGKAHERTAIEIAIVAPNGHVVASIPGEIAPAETGPTFVNANLIGLQFPVVGYYDVVVRAAGAAIFTTRLELAVAPATRAATH